MNIPLTKRIKCKFGFHRFTCSIPEAQKGHNDLNYKIHYYCNYCPKEKFESLNETLEKNEKDDLMWPFKKKEKQHDFVDFGFGMVKNIKFDLPHADKVRKLFIEEESKPQNTPVFDRNGIQVGTLIETSTDKNGNLLGKIKLHSKQKDE